MEEILTMLPDKICKNVRELIKEKADFLEEIRLRVNRPIELCYCDQVIYGANFSSRDGEIFLSRISQFSFYMMEEQFKRGYVTLVGGHRVGLAGRTLIENGTLKGLRDIGSFNIRIAREKVGVSNDFISDLYTNRWLSTLIIGAPQTGKTTYLRDLARNISTGVKERKIRSQKVGIVDERSEIAGCIRGIPQMTFGNRIDILDSCPKAEGMMMLIRSMSPDVIVVDEIGRTEDVFAIAEAMHGGISLFASVHGNGLQDVLKRPTMKKIFELGSFLRVVELARNRKGEFLVQIYDGKGQVLIK